MIYRVAVNAPLWTLLDYEGDSGLRPGQAVTVELGQRQVHGLIIEAVPRAKAENLKPILLAHALPAMPKELLMLLRWCWEYYHHPPGEVAWAALPPALDTAQEELWYGLSNDLQLKTGAFEAAVAECKRAPRQQELLNALHESSLSESHLNESHPNWRTPMKRLLEREWVKLTDPLPPPPLAPAGRAPILREEQAAAVEAITDVAEKYQTWLLEGVTGSGKTEVYLQAARHFISRGRQVLLLVPEIALTPQTLQRVRQRLGVEVGEYHSGMPDAARREVWRRVAVGELAVVVGTRSSVFLPFTRLGFIALDEEHDGSYKQQDGFHYSARDLAIVRAHKLNIPIVLGSATPALETLANAQRKRYKKLELKERHGSESRWQLVDVRGLKHSSFSPVALEAMRECLAQGEQVMVFRNRRGYAPVVMCGDCGWAASCLRCDSHMTLHLARQRLICHHCGTEHKQPIQCPSCQNESLVNVGQGTERLEEELHEHFKDFPIYRVDRDRMRGRGAMEEVRQKVLSGEPCILVGTQMLAKGHDFPNLALVIVIEADQALYSADFRAPERLGQLLVQVAGRAGRGEQPGRVMIQTCQPEHPLLTTLMEGGYPALAQKLLQERRDAELPPYTAQAMLRADALKPDPPRQWLEQARSLLRKQVTQNQLEVQLMGPFPAMMERRAGRWRWQLCLQSLERSQIKQLLDLTLPALRELPEGRQIRWRVDVDPYEL